MENYSLLMGAAAAVMKMAVEMAAVSMEKPSGALPRSGRREMNHIATGTAPSLDGELLPPHGSSSGDEDGGGDGSGVDGEAFRGHFPAPAGCRNRDSCPPDLGFAMAAARKVSRTVAFSKRKMNNYNFGEVFEGETTSTGRPSRASTRIRRSYNEDVIAPSFDEGNGDPNASSFPCYEFLSNAGLLDDFLTLVRKAGLTAYMEDERKQYYMLTKIFVESFKFNNKHFNPTVAFKIYGNPITMKLKDFCDALDIAPAGTARKIEDNPRVLLELYREITNDDCRTIQRGKIRNIQLPAIKYFAYYLATSILGRENTSNISSYHLAFLIAALTGETPYHLGSVIARRLSNKGPIYGGIIASRILARLDLPLDPTDVEIPPVRLDIAAMKSHQFVTVDSSMDNIVYRTRKWRSSEICMPKEECKMKWSNESTCFPIDGEEQLRQHILCYMKHIDLVNMPIMNYAQMKTVFTPRLMLFADGDEREVLLPQTDLFSIGRKPWSRSKEEVDEQLKIQGFHQQHDSEDAEPSYDYTVTLLLLQAHT
ncbi:hypothetical protein QYE76_051517 [Lolium multiflorum]|uniref:Arabidopsis retrotransposon Orf1 C-terminal domain-containing protein n=1 Tax=Lolium multiflorum TaxID=4521 RepID=A0AAD8SS06_LOLMU|nr:hypothetical protein QYE76_051517 [Lolium multiflorum]